MTAALMILVDCKLAEERNRHRIRLVALLRFGQESSLDLRRAQCDEADNFCAGGVADDVGARNACGMIGEGVSPEPMVQ